MDRNEIVNTQYYGVHVNATLTHIDMENKENAIPLQAIEPTNTHARKRQ